MEKKSKTELRTDLGNARRLIREHGSDLRHCKAWRKWLVWDKKRWKTDDTGEIERRAKKTAGAMLCEATKIASLDEKGEAVKHALRTQGKHRLAAMIDVAETEARVVIRPDELDANPYLLNCTNGTLDLRTGSLRNYHRDDLIMKLAPVTYNPNAQCPIFDRFLVRIMDGNQELISYLQRCIGYALTGDVREKALFVLVGKGDNGKTTLVEALRYVLGDYAGQLPIECLMTKRSE